MLDVSDRLPRLVASGVTGSISRGSSTTIYCTDLVNTDSWVVFISIESCDSAAVLLGNYGATINSGNFVIQNTTTDPGSPYTGACTYSYWVINT